jgi:hypothetical protein
VPQELQTTTKELEQIHVWKYLPKAEGNRAQTRRPSMNLHLRKKNSRPSEGRRETPRRNGGM